MNKKYILKVAIISAIALVSSWNIIKSHSTSEIDLSDTALANVEALADENGLADALNCYLYGCQPNTWYDCHVYIFGSYSSTCSFHKG
jgi:hypothetical protein